MVFSGLTTNGQFAPSFRLPVPPGQHLTLSSIHLTLTALKPVGKYGPTGQHATSIRADVGFVKCRLGVVENSTGLKYNEKPFILGIQSLSITSNF